MSYYLALAVHGCVVGVMVEMLFERAGAVVLVLWAIWMVATGVAAFTAPPKARS